LYADGYERPDVINYRENKFLPAWAKIQERMETWTKTNLPTLPTFAGLLLPCVPALIWYVLFSTWEYSH
jgi:hypothetical protein